MDITAGELRKKRITFTLIFVAFTAVYGLITWMGEGKLTEQAQQYIVLGWRLSIAALSLWFGYAIGIKKQTTWFVSMLAILPIVSWLGVLYLLFKSGTMLVSAKKGETSQTAGRQRDVIDVKSEDRARKNKKKSKK